MRTFVKSNTWRTGGAYAVLILALAGTIFTAAPGCRTEVRSDETVLAAPPPAPIIEADNGQPVPRVINEVHARGELLYGLVKARDWIQAARVIGWFPEGAADMPHSERLSNAVGMLRLAIADRDIQGSMLAANQITGVAIDASAPYASRIPLEVARLGHLGRQLEVESLGQMGSAAVVTSQRIRETWRDLRPVVTARVGSVQATTMDAVVARLDRAGGGFDYLTEASIIQSEVGRLQDVFSRP
jgi:hypothetical protein